jgi:hypothetical protein
VKTVEIDSFPDHSALIKENTEVDFTCRADANPPVEINVYVGDILLYKATGKIVKTKQKLKNEYNGLPFKCVSFELWSNLRSYNIICKYIAFYA